MPLPLLALGASLLPNIMGLFTGGAQKRAARKAAQQAQQHFNQSVGYANEGLNTAKNLYNQSRLNYNGRMAGAGALENNIYNSQANTQAALERNSTSAAQQLALAGSLQANTNDAFNNLGQLEAQDKQGRFGQMAYAGQGVQAANQNLQNLYSNQSLQAQQAAQQLGQSGITNQFQALQGIGNAAMVFGPQLFSGGGNPFKPQAGALGAGAVNPTSFNMWSGMQQPTINYTLPGITKYIKQ